MFMLRNFIIVLIAILSVAVSATAQRRNSLSPRLHALAAASAAAPEGADTLACARGDLVFSGYDKPLRASRETLFITNHMSADVVRAVFHIEYFDLQGRQIHRRRCSVAVDLPAGETRCVDLPAWDRQGTYYFRGSRRPKVSGVPYTVAVTPDSVVILR